MRARIAIVSPSLAVPPMLGGALAWLAVMLSCVAVPGRLEGQPAGSRSEAAGEGARAAAAYLESVGLARNPNGDWFSPTMIRVQQGVEACREAASEWEKCRQLLESQQKLNAQRWATLQRERTLLPKRSGEQKKIAAARIAQMELRTVAPEELARHPSLIPQLARCVCAHERVITAHLELLDAVGRFRATARKLDQDPEVRTRLTQLGGQAIQLSDQEYRETKEVLATGNESYLTGQSWFYVRGGHVRLAVVLNDQHPVRVSWNASQQVLVLTQSVALRLGWQPNEFPREKRTILQQDLEVGVTKLSQLRLAGHVSHDVPTVVLPPQAEYLGCSLGQAALGTKKLTFDWITQTCRFE